MPARAPAPPPHSTASALTLLQSDPSPPTSARHVAAELGFIRGGSPACQGGSSSDRSFHSDSPFPARVLAEGPASPGPLGRAPRAHTQPPCPAPLPHTAHHLSRPHSVFVPHNVSSAGQGGGLGLHRNPKTLTGGLCRAPANVTPSAPQGSQALRSRGIVGLDSTPTVGCAFRLQTNTLTLKLPLPFALELQGPSMATCVACHCVQSTLRGPPTRPRG